MATNHSKEMHLSYVHLCLLSFLGVSMVLLKAELLMGDPRVEVSLCVIDDEFIVQVGTIYKAWIQKPQAHEETKAQ